MEHRPQSLGTRIAFMVLMGWPLCAVQAADDSLQAKRSKADQLEREAKTLRSEAEVAFKANEAECKRHLLVNDCINGAKARRLEQVELARVKEKEKALLEREIRRKEYDDRQTKRLEKHIKEGAPPAVVIQGAPERPEVKPVE